MWNYPWTNNGIMSTQLRKIDKQMPSEREMTEFPLEEEIKNLNYLLGIIESSLMS